MLFFTRLAGGATQSFAGLHRSLVDLDEARLTEDLALTKLADFCFVRVRDLLSETTLLRYPVDLAVEDASHAPFRLRAVEELTHALVLSLHWNGLALHLHDLKLPFTHDVHEVVD